MSRGKRYNGEKKLNLKKVFAVIIAIIVIVMFIVGIKKLLKTGKKEVTKEFSKGYFAAFENEAWGVINEKGDFVIEPTYTEMVIVPDSTKDVFICMDNVNYDDNTYDSKAINSANETLFSEYDSVEVIENYDDSYNLWYEKNVLKVKKDGKYGLIDFDGKVLLNCEYDEISTIKGVTNSLLTKKDGKYGLCDNTGSIIIQNEYAEIKSLTDKYSDGYIVKNSDGKYGVIKCDKQTAIKAQYSDIANVYGNNEYVVKLNGKWQVINSDEEAIISSGFDEIKSIDGDNITFVKNGKYGVMNSSQQILIEAQYDKLTYIFSNYYIAQKDDKYGVISTEGEEKLPVEYGMITYNKEADFVEVEELNGASTVYDRNFESKFNGFVCEVNTDKDYMLAYVDGDYKYYNFKFEEKQSTKLLYENTLFLKKENGKYGYVNKDGVVVVNYVYDDATQQNQYGYVAVKKDGVWGVIDQNGNTVLTPSVNLDDNIKINFIGKWHLAEDINANYYVK